jgi:hypothetical protein
MPYITVSPYKVICREKETLEGKDFFALAGAVIVDGKATPFAMPARAMTRGSVEEWWPADVFNGYSNSLRFGLSVVAWDIDKNSKWVKNRDDVKEVSSAVAAFVEQLPVVGDIAGFIVENWPYAVDFFVELDKNDQVIKWSGYLDIDLPSPNRSNYRDFEIRSTRKDVTGYSDWDYSVYVGVTASNPQPFVEGPAPVRSQSPKKDTKFDDWVGRWEGQNVMVAISKVVSRGEVPRNRVRRNH